MSQIVQHLPKILREMSQSRLDRTDEGDAVERGQVCHCKHEVDEAELNSGGKALDCPTLPHFQGQQRERELIVITVPQKEADK